MFYCETRVNRKLWFSAVEGKPLTGQWEMPVFARCFVRWSLDQNGSTSVGVCGITALSLLSESGESGVLQVNQIGSDVASESEIIKMTIRKGYFGLEGEKSKTSEFIVSRCQPEI